MTGCTHDLNEIAIEPLSPSISGSIGYSHGCPDCSPPQFTDRATRIIRYRSAVGVLCTCPKMPVRDCNLDLLYEDEAAWDEWADAAYPRDPDCPIRHEMLDDLEDDDGGQQ